jgi:hypothetical protein
MKKALSTAVCGLLWLAFSGMGFASSILTLSYNFSADTIGGGFNASLSGGPSNFEVYCVDYLNGEVSPENVNIEIPNLGQFDNGLATARYGTTTSFLFNSLGGGGTTILSSGSQFGNSYDRYVMAAWLTTQYNRSQPNSVTNDAIQSAIWTLLDTNGQTFYNNAFGNDTPDTQAQVAGELQAALNFMSNTTNFNNFAADVRIYTSTDTTPGNPFGGGQEMISVMPEPADLALVGTGLFLLGLLRRHHKARQ